MNVAETWLCSMNYKYVGVMVFVLGVLGVVVNRRNLLIVLMSIELMLLGIIYLLVQVGKEVDDVTSGVFVLLVLTVAASESAIGLGILVAYYRARGTIAMESLNLLRG